MVFQSSGGQRAFVSFCFYFLFLSAFPCLCQIYKPFTALRVIETEHFEIIFPAESEPTAQALAAFADGAYREISSLLGIELAGKVPVSISGHTDEFNGYMNPFPYTHIVLYDTPVDIEWTGFTNSLYTLFYHELTHAVSMSSKSPFFRLLHTVFGAWIYPIAFSAPMFMTEGGAVAFESLKGSGRSNDPLVKTRLRQAILDGNFLNPFQASGIYDLPPAQTGAYDYGGLFNTYIIDHHGPERYARLWQEMGTAPHLSLFFYNHGFYDAFEEVYQSPFLSVWEDFKASFILDSNLDNTIEDNTNGVIEGRNQGSEKLLIPAISSDNGTVYYMNKVNGKLFAYTAADGSLQKRAALDSSVYELDASGGKILASSYRHISNLATAIVTEYTEAGWATGRAWSSLYKAHYFRDGVIGLASNLHANNLVFRSGTGAPSPETEEVLLRGNAELLFSSPHAIDDTWIAFICLRKGRRELCLYNYDRKTAYTLVSPLRDDGERWANIRNLSVSEGRILFSYNHDERLYKLGLIAVSTLQQAGTSETAASLDVIFSEKDISGSVFSPVICGTRIYYRAAFSTWDAFMEYPESSDALSGLCTQAVLVPWNDTANMAILPAPPAPQPRQTRSFYPFKYFNPLNLWFPIPLFNARHGWKWTSEEPLFAGGGFFTYLADPSDTNLIFLSAAWDMAKMASIDLSWTNYGLVFPLEITFRDLINRQQSYDVRETQGSIALSVRVPLWNDDTHIGIAAGVGASVYAYELEEKDNAYQWPYWDTPAYSASFLLQFSNKHKRAWEIFGTGVQIAGAYRRLLNSAYQENPDRYEGLLHAAFTPLLPVQFTFYGAYDLGGMNLYGESYRYSSTIFEDSALIEYSTKGIGNLEWIAGGQTALGLFSFELQNSLSHAYFNRIFGIAAYRGLLYKNPYPAAAQQPVTPEGTVLHTDYLLAQSVRLTLGLSVSNVLLTAMPFSINPSFWYAWKFSNRHDTDKSNDFSLGFSIGLEF
ncbi:hypothetical protein ACYULU_11925 [Breznakiellaceae bacterium SP9]